MTFDEMVRVGKPSLMFHVPQRSADYREVRDAYDSTQPVEAFGSKWVVRSLDTCVNSIAVTLEPWKQER